MINCKITFEHYKQISEFYVPMRFLIINKDFPNLNFTQLNFRTILRVK